MPARRCYVALMRSATAMGAKTTGQGVDGDLGEGELSQTALLR